MPPSNPMPEYFVRKEDSVTPECKALLPTLPTEEGWKNARIYKYKGFWFLPHHLCGYLTFHRHFQPQASDCILVTPPKAGTTWLKALAFAVANRTQFPPGDPNHPLLSNNSQELVQMFEMQHYDGGRVPDLASLPEPRLFGTHVPYTWLPDTITKSAGCKIVFLCRNPSDNFVSLWKFSERFSTPEFPPASMEEAFELFCTGRSICGPYWGHVLGYWKASQENPQKVLFLKYEELKENPSFHAKKLAEFMGFPFSPEEEREGVAEEIVKICSFEKMSILEVNKNGTLRTGFPNNKFFRKGVVGDWANHLSPEMVKRLDEITKEKLQGSGLNLDAMDLISGHYTVNRNKPSPFELNGFETFSYLPVASAIIVGGITLTTLTLNQAGRNAQHFMSSVLCAALTAGIMAVVKANGRQFCSRPRLCRLL